MKHLWRVRDGRGPEYTLWRDELGDAMARIGLTIDDIGEEPPTPPTSQSSEHMSLWIAATLQYQKEGTDLFDLVRPSLIIDGPYAARDIRLISTWKRDGNRNGRALLRWALSFVDRSSIADQMDLLTQMNSMKLSAKATLFEMTEHFLQLWELWMSLTTSDPAEPASFFQVLLHSMPTEPEGPVVLVRRELAKMIRLNESPLLRDIDGEKGLFAAMEAYGVELGMSKALPASLNALGSGGGGKTAGANNGDDNKGKCTECRAFACKRQDGGCICKANSKFDISAIEQKGRRDYVALMRRYNKANPGKSLQVRVKLVREALGDKEPTKDASGKESEKDGKVTFMASVKSVLGDEATDSDALDKWLEAHTDGEFFVLGDSVDIARTSGEGELQFEVEEDEHMLCALDSSGSSGAQSARTAKEITNAEMDALRSQLLAANARVNELETAAASATATPATARKPDPAIDAPPPMPATRFMQLAQMTPKQAYRTVFMADASPPQNSGGGVSLLRPRFTPKESPIDELTADDLPKQAKSGRISSTEYMARGIAEHEAEKRRLLQKAREKGKVKVFLRDVLIFGRSGILNMGTVLLDTASDLTFHQLITCSLLLAVFGPRIKPLLKIALGKLGDLALSSAIQQLVNVASVARIAVHNLAATVVAKLVAIALRQAPSPSAALDARTAPAPGTVTATPSSVAAAEPSASAAPARVATATVGTIDGGDHDQSSGGALMALEHLGKSVLMTGSELQAEGGLKPGLLDDGASSNTSCAKSLDGAIPGTFRAEDAGEIGLGSDGATLKSNGSHLYALERHGANGSELVVRRLKHTPNLPMPYVFSEAGENRIHKYGIYWEPGKPRVLKSPKGIMLELFMSSTDLGWVKVAPVTDGKKVLEMLKEYKRDQQMGTPYLAMIHPPSTLSYQMDPSKVRTVGMGGGKTLKGVALLRRRHIIDGHVSLPITVKNLRAEGAFDKKLVTLKDVEIFASQGCGPCERTKMKRRPFTTKVGEDTLKPKLGEMFVFDVLQLRVPAEHTGATFLYLAIEKISKYAIAGSMRGYSEEDVVGALNELKARVRPTHGEIKVLRADSHPSHKSKHVRDYLLESQLRLQLSPPYVHEGVGDPENFFLHNVPSANALLAAAPDLGETHFSQAFFYVVHAKNHSMTSNSNPPRSPAMSYFSLDKYQGSELLAFGAACMALVHGEARDSKFDDHAQPCVYVGPPINSDSRAHCAVWFKREYRDVDLGCISVNEQVVIERTRREHPSTQPYNQVAATKTVDLGKPVSILDLSGMDYSEDALPECEPIIWVRSMELPQEDFVLLLWAGEKRAGDMASWVYELSGKAVTPYPIDVHIGGQEHNLQRKPVKDAVLTMHESAHCLASFLQPECSPFSASRFKQPGPPVLFNLDHVDGIADEDGEPPLEVMQALNDVRFCAMLFKQTANTGKVCMLEYPASQGRGSPFAATDRELHSTLADTTIMTTVTRELGLTTVYTEQGASGAATRKPTALLTTANGAHPLRCTVGTLFVKPGTNLTNVVGAQNEDGSYKTKALGKYSPKFAMQLSIALLSAGRRDAASGGALAANISSALANAATERIACDDLHPVGSRVELYWYGEQRWYRGTVVDTRIRKGQVHGASIQRREIQVRYDEDESLLWHAICDYSVRAVADEQDEPTQVVLNMITARDELLAAAAQSMNVLSNDATYLTLDGEATPAVVLDGEPVYATSAHSRGEDPNPDHSQVGDESLSLKRHAGEIFTASVPVHDLETQRLISRQCVYAVLGDGSVEHLNVDNAHTWHTPRNEREYNMSPQRDLWRVAKELKMEDYANVHMYDLVPESSVDKSKYKIYDTLWAYKIKFKNGTTFQKLNPRWCVKGGTMDRSLYKSYSEMMRMSSLNIFWALKGLYYESFAAGLYDMSDAFQDTPTVDSEGELLKGEHEFYTRQAPGFVKYGPNGESLVCRQRCFMQGRIDATRGFDKAITHILTSKCGLSPLLWDNKVYEYHNTPLKNTTASLDEIMQSSADLLAAGKDSGPQQPPIGYALFGTHVDDISALATGALDITKNRILQYVRGEIATAYATKLVPWQDNKMLGYELHLDDDEKTVTVTAQGVIDSVRARLISKDNITITPKHIVTERVYEKWPGNVPEVGDPSRASYLERQELVRHTLGVGIWASNAYPQIASGINAMCTDMANPGDERLAQLRHMFMHLGEKPQGKVFGGRHITGCCATEAEVAPFTQGKKSGQYHFFSDASINVTGGIGMFGGGCIQALMLRQHLESPSAHTSEIVAAGTNMNHIIPVNGLLQELHIRQGQPTRMYLDSQSTVYVATSDTAPKKSVWLTRRNKVLAECVEHGEVEPIHIGEADMVADSYTKYVKRETWARHMHYILNLPGDPPDCHDADWVRVPTVKSKPKSKSKPKVAHKA